MLKCLLLEHKVKDLHLDKQNEQSLLPKKKKHMKQSAKEEKYLINVTALTFKRATNLLRAYVLIRALSIEIFEYYTLSAFAVLFIK